MKKLFFLLLCVSGPAICLAQSPDALTFFQTNYQTLITRMDYGEVIKRSGKNPFIIIDQKNIPVGRDYVHVFFDEYGNLVSDNIPNGIPWVNYVIHVIHPKSTGETYDVVQTAGSISGQLVIRNATTTGIATPNAVRANVDTTLADEETVSVLSPTDKVDIGFQIIKTVVSSTSATKTPIGPYTITMSGYFNASIDLGILNSKLHNPTYTLVNSASTTGEMVVKAGDNGDRTMTTVMGTIYFSPIVFIEKEIFNIDIPKFKLKGRSSVADHNLIERIYPTFGLSIYDYSFLNIFYGLNWEIIRGGSLFVGFHTGKINVYNGSPGFQFGQTATTSDEFNLNTDTKWDTKFAIGATIDLKVVLGLISTSVK